MTKFLLLIAVLGIVLWYFFRPQRPGKVASEDESRPVERITVCAHCGLRFPESEAVAHDGRHYCCEEHRRLGAS